MRYNISQGESETVEFKESLGEWKEIINTISAFSNTNGGVILVGINDCGGISGVITGKSTLEDLTNKINENTDPKIYPHITTKLIDGKSIVIIEIKESFDHLVVAFGRPYKRVGKSTVRMSKDEYESLILEKHKEKLYFDSQICKEASLGDIDNIKVKRFIERANFERRLEINPNITPKEALKKLSLVKKDKLANAAILLFGKNPQKFFLQAETRCARFKGTEPLEFIDMKVFGGNIIDQREDALEFVKEHIQLHAEIKGTERIERWEYPIEAIREAITNAICHRNYKISSNAQIRIFDDRIEVWGCGPLPEPLTVEDLRKKHDSVLRNPLIGKCFFLIKYIEQWGTGTNRMIKKCLSSGLPEPLFEEISGNLVVTFRGKITKEYLEGLDLNKRQIVAMEYIKKIGKITNKKYREMFPEISNETARLDLNILVRKRLLNKKGEKRGAYYTIR
ncbi:MAG: helix-turn-helix domain-containing protein [Candidatus Cloacimonadota bacterium]|nr:helix-turn-helix domain-containing protein [Candidatus Cloacimonadota bacterium]